MPKLRILLAYDGTDYRGFSLNPGVPTIAGKLKSALEQVLDYEVSLVCAGRTDAGVHAYGQVVSVELKDDNRDLQQLQDSLNDLCGGDISIRELKWMPADFDARTSAKSRLYYYLISNRLDINPFIRHTSWHIAEELDLKGMRKATRQILGECDFTSFCRKPEDPTKSLFRFVMRTGWEKPDENDPTLLRFHIQADAFCHQMVRSLVGTLVDMGRGKLDPKKMIAILKAKDRSRAGQLAPPQGLFLQEVFY